LFRKKQKE